MFENNIEKIKILAIESSCDETSAAVVVNGREMKSNVISTQIPLHTLYGGVVPEIASRAHIERINQVIEKALEDAGETFDTIDAVAVTKGPGLVGSLPDWGFCSKGDCLGKGQAAHRREPHCRACRSELHFKS